MKTFLSALLLALCALPAGAGTTTPEDQLRTFATCTGRLSAQMEFQWMFDGPGSEVTQARRADLIEILSAIMPEGRGRDVLNWRINAKAAHYALLTRATFGQNPDDAAWATRQAEALTADCTALLLS